MMTRSMMTGEQNKIDSNKKNGKDNKENGRKNKIDSNKKNKSGKKIDVVYSLWT